MRYLDFNSFNSLLDFFLFFVQSKINLNLGGISSCKKKTTVDDHCSVDIIFSLYIYLSFYIALPLNVSMMYRSNLILLSFRKSHLQKRKKSKRRQKISSSSWTEEVRSFSLCFRFVSSLHHLTVMELLSTGMMYTYIYILTSRFR